MKSYDRLKAIILDIDELLSKNVTSSSPDFVALKTRIERFLITEYGPDSYEMTEFQQRHFAPGVLTYKVTQSDFIEHCKKGLEQTKAVLSSYLEELSEKKEQKDKINSFEKLKFEYHGIVNVVKEYTKEGFILNFLEGLGQGLNHRNKNMIKYFLSEIIKWYENNWDDICNNEFVYNLEDHKRNKQLLEEILEGISDCEFLDVENSKESNYSSEPTVFISHCSTDKKYGDALEKLFSSIGIKKNQLIYTSHPLHKIPLDKNIYDYLRESFGRKIFVIILWSNDYLDSPACLNEMGAMWVTKSDYTNLYVPSFDFKNIPRILRNLF